MFDDRRGLVMHGVNRIRDVDQLVRNLAPAIVDKRGQVLLQSRWTGWSGFSGFMDRRRPIPFYLRDHVRQHHDHFAGRPELSRV